MRDHDFQTRREARGFERPVGQKRSGHNQEAWRAPCRALGLFIERLKQGQNLNRFAEAHVVGEAGAEPKLSQEMEPAQSCLLIGPQRRLQGLARTNLRQAIGAPASLERRGEPGTGLNMGP
jgi:hypothetical protein